MSDPYSDPLGAVVLVEVRPHHPDCRGVPPTPASASLLDPERCCYCAALVRGEREPLDYRYGGPKCYCAPADGPELSYRC